MIKPFVIRQLREEYLISPESSSFNPQIEKRIQFVQGANTFIAVMLAYDSIEHAYQFYKFYGDCASYSYMYGALLIGNIFWILSSIFGFLSIDAKNSYKIHRFYILLLWVFITRIGVYSVIAYKMNKVIFIQDIANRSEIICDSLNQIGLIIIQISIESVVLIVMIFFSHSIRHYVRLWEFNENKKNWIE